MAERKFDKQKLFSAAVIVILLIFFVGGFWIGLDRVRSMEGTFPPNDIKEGLSAAPETAGALYFEILETGNFTVGAYSGFAYYLLRAKRV